MPDRGVVDRETPTDQQWALTAWIPACDQGAGEGATPYVKSLPMRSTSTAFLRLRAILARQVIDRSIDSLATGATHPRRVASRSSVSRSGIGVLATLCREQVTVSARTRDCLS